MENVHQPQGVLLIGNAQIAAHLVFLNVLGVDDQHDFHLILQGLQHANLAVRLKARQHPGSVMVVKQLAAEFQIQFPAKPGDALPNLFGLQGKVFCVVKADAAHFAPPFMSISSRGRLGT